MWQLVKTIGKSAWEPALATLLFLILFEIHGSIIHSALTYAGLRTDVPVVIAVLDRCNNVLALNRTARLLDSTGTQSTEPGCSGSIFVPVANPVGESVQLFINRTPTATLTGTSQRVIFSDIPVQPGRNLITVAGANARLWLPYGSPFAPASFPIDFGDPPPISSLKDVRRNVEAFLGAEIALPVPDWEPQVLGGWQTPGEPKRRWVLTLGAPGSRPDMYVSSTQHGAFDLSGLDIRPVGDAEAAETGALQAPDLSRRLRIARGPDGGLDVNATACLPAASLLVTAARHGGLQGSEFLARVFNTQAGAWGYTKEIRKFQTGTVSINDSSAKSCTELKSAFHFPYGEFILQQLELTSFPNLPGDSLTLENAGPDVEVHGRQPDKIDDGKQIWLGRTSTIEGSWLGIWSGRGRSPMESVTSTDDRGTNVHPTFLSQFRGLFYALPGWLVLLLQQLTPIVPLGILLWVLLKHGRDAVPTGVRHRASAALIALMVFVGAFALQQPLTTLTFKILAAQSVASHFDYYSFAAFDRSSGIADVQTPLAFIVVILLVPMLRSALDPKEPTKWRYARFPAIAITIGLILLGSELLAGELPGLQALLAQTTHIDFAPPEGEYISLEALALIVCLWCLLGLILFWLPVYWILRAMISRGSVWRPALLTALLVFFLPLFVQALELTSLAYGLGGAPIARVRPTDIHAFVDLMTTKAQNLVALVLIVFVLRGFREIAVAILAPARAEILARWTHWWVLVLAAIAIIVTIQGPSYLGALEVQSAVLQVMYTLQTYTPIFGLAVVFSIVEADHAQRTGHETAFALPQGIVMIGGAAFAGYLSIWGNDPASVLILVVVGWLLFTRVMVPAPATWTEPEREGLAQRLIEYRDAQGLLAGRRKSAERDYMDRKISAEMFEGELTTLSSLKEQSARALGVPPEQAKFWILNFGPERTPLGNATIGAAFGLIAAIVLQIVVILTRTPENEASTAPLWLSLANSMVSDLSHPFVSEGSDSLLLSLLSAIVNTFAFWMILGFIFGMVFHRLRGSDGFVKALTFSAGMAVPYLLSQLLVGSGTHGGLDLLLRLVPIIAMLLLLGVAVFDGLSLYRQGLGPSALPDVYGINTSIGYASLAGVIASIQPIFQLVSRIFKKPSSQ